MPVNIEDQALKPVKRAFVQSSASRDQQREESLNSEDIMVVEEVSDEMLDFEAFRGAR